MLGQRDSMDEWYGCVGEWCARVLSETDGRKAYSVDGESTDNN